MGSYKKSWREILLFVCLFVCRFHPESRAVGFSQPGNYTAFEGSYSGQRSQETVAFQNSFQSCAVVLTACPYKPFLLVISLFQSSSFQLNIQLPWCCGHLPIEHAYLPTGNKRHSKTQQKIFNLECSGTIPVSVQ